MTETLGTPSQQPLTMNRRRMLASTALSAAGLTGLASLVACGSTTTTASTSGAASSGPFPSHPKWNFVFVNHVTTNAFFTPTRYGIADACALLGCQYQWVGSESSVVSEMVDAMNSAISSKADGIAVALIDNNAFNAPTDQALAAGIPVVAYNADVPAGNPNKRLAYIGQDLYQSGLQVGAKIISLVPSGDIVGFIATPGSLNIQPRIDGIKAAITASKLPINFVEIASGATINVEGPAIDAYYQGHKNLKGMVAVDGGSTASVGQTMEKYSLAAAGVHAGGYDLEPVTLAEVGKGNLDFTIDQQPYLQGFLPVVQMFLYKLSGGLAQPSTTDTGLLFVTKDNVGNYTKVATRFEGSSANELIVTPA
jgi:simple sugar transport system substrate-binding protein